MKQYKPHWAKQILPKKRCWCLLKMANNRTYPFVVAQWDPSIQGGSWVLCNPTRDLIRPSSAADELVDWFVYLED
jgi:hypothetical protein